MLVWGLLNSKLIQRITVKAVDVWRWHFDTSMICFFSGSDSKSMLTVKAIFDTFPFIYFFIFDWFEFELKQEKQTQLVRVWEITGEWGGGRKTGRHGETERRRDKRRMKEEWTEWSGALLRSHRNSDGDKLEILICLMFNMDCFKLYHCRRERCKWARFNHLFWVLRAFTRNTFSYIRWLKNVLTFSFFTYNTKEWKRS